MLLPWFAVGFVLGLWLGLEVSLPTGAALLLLVSLGCSYLVLRSLGLQMGLPLLVAAGLLLGLARGGPTLLDPPGDLHLYHGREVQLGGRITSLPALVGGQVRLDLEAAEVLHPNGDREAVEGRLLVRANTEVEPIPGRDYPFLAFGDWLVIQGVPEPPAAYAGFDYPQYLASQGIGSVMYNARVVAVGPAHCCGWGLDRLHRIRSTLAGSLSRALPEPAAGLTQALLVGIRSGVSPSVVEDFRRSGTAHLLAISGLHVGIILALSLALFQAVLGRRWGLYLLIPFLLIWAYALLAGWSPSVVRAGLMGTAYLLALAAGRSASPLNSLALATLLMLAWQPRWLWHLSFQLSFTAMAGILVIGLPLWDALRRTKWTGTQGLLSTRVGVWAVGGLSVSAGAVLGTLPLVTFNFHQLPLLGIPATLLMLPVLPVMLVGGLLAGVAQWLWPPLSWAVSWLPALLADYLAGVARLVSAVPGSLARVAPASGHLVWAYYLVLLGVMAAVHRSRWFPPALREVRALWSGPALSRHRALVVVALLPLVLTPWVLGLTRTEGLMHAYFLDVGQGDASLLRTPGGFTMLVDGGPDEVTTLAAVDRVLPFWDRAIDAAVLSHPDADHFNGLMGLAQGGRLRIVLVPPVVEEDGGLWRRKLESTGVEILEGRAGTDVSFPDGVRLQVLHPPLPPLEGTGADRNNNSLVVRVSYRNASILFPGDLEAEGESVLLDSGAGLDARVLKLPHHGSGSSSTNEFLMAVAPAVAIVSAGEGNPFGHPSPDVLERVRRLASEQHIYETAAHGTIHLATDGEQWWASTSR